MGEKYSPKPLKIAQKAIVLHTFEVQVLCSTLSPNLIPHSGALSLSTLGNSMQPPDVTLDGAFIAR